jgi:predicted phage baseplate assembly protein
VTVALTATGKDPVTVPKGTAVRSAGFGAEKPQVFELEADTVAYPQLDALVLAPVRPATFDGNVWLHASATQPNPGEAVVFRYGSHRVAMVVEAVTPQKASDGDTYRRVTFTGSLPGAAVGTAMTGVSLTRFSQSAVATRFTKATNSGASTSSNAILLDAQYPQIVAGTLVMVETATTIVAGSVSAVANVWVNADPAGKGQFALTEVTLLDDAGNALNGAVRVHFGGVSVGRLTNPAMTRLTPAQLAADRALKDPLESLASPPQQAIWKGSEAAAYLSQVAYGFDAPGHASTARALEPAEIKSDLHVPVKVMGNVARFTRGESVTGEVLGSSDGRTAWQSFRLKKKPLTWLPDGGGAGALAPALTVRVDGVVWTRRDSLVDARPGDRVYMVQTGFDGESRVVFGEAAIPAAGVGNIVADYRYGAGAAKPPAGLVNALSGRVPGISGVAWSLEPEGGSDGDTLETLKTAAPRSMLTFGRAVSLADYEALSRFYPGVVNCSVGWGWAKGSQRAQVVVWVVSDQGSVATALSAALRSAGDADVPVAVAESAAIPTPVDLEIRIDDTYLAGDVTTRVAAALTDETSGLLAVRNRTLTASVYRSAVVAAVMAVPGVTAVARLTLDNDPAAAGVTTPQGHHRVFTLSLAVVS